MNLATDPFAPERVILAPNEQITIRLLESTDAPKLIDYFNDLSDQTKQYFAPHPFDSASVNHICATLDPNQLVRLIAISADNQLIIAYSLLLFEVILSDAARYKTLGIKLNPETDCSLAPSIADTYQSRGLGTHLMARTLTIARAMNKKRVVLWGGVQATNERAVHYYRKYGFVTAGDFDRNGLNHAMYLDLS